MLTANVIAKKRDGKVLHADEIRFMVNGFVSGEVADYQMTAFAMAVLLRGMTSDEIATLTLAMLDSGERLPRATDQPPRVDKHSTGGLGDNVSLLLAPLLACHEVIVPMISGRGLGLTGGTLDKLEAIPGFQVHLDPATREQQLSELGCFIVGASERIAPADRRLYALRDVTGTVESVPLITASILSKKLAASLDALVMDVKFGSAAFMKTQPQAMELAHSIVATSAIAGLPTTALLTDMDQPLSQAVGNAIEVNDILALFDGQGSRAVLQLTLELCASVLQLCGRYASKPLAMQALQKSIDDGSARERFDRMIAAQGGQLSGPLPLAQEQVIVASTSGYVQGFDCEALGTCVIEMGGGRRVASDRIDPTVGVAVLKRIGEQVQIGEPVLKFYSRSGHAEWSQRLAKAIRIQSEPNATRPLIVAELNQDPKQE